MDAISKVDLSNTILVRSEYGAAESCCKKKARREGKCSCDGSEEVGGTDVSVRRCAGLLEASDYAKTINQDGMETRQEEDDDVVFFRKIALS